MSKYSNQKKNINEDIILNSLYVYIDISTDLLAFQKQLYSQAHLLNRSIFKTFRKIRDSVEDLYNKISNFTSDNAAFIKQKQKIIQKQIQAMQSNIKTQDLLQKSKTKEKFPKNQNQKNENGPKITQSFTQRQHEHIIYLQEQIELLKSQLRRNDTQYQIQIKKYNVKYDQMLEEINYYRQQLNKMAQLEDIIDKLEVEVKVMQEVKQRDEQLIQNMAKKIRNFERDRYGMISPSNLFKDQNNYGSPRLNPVYSPKSRIYTRLQ